MCVRLFIYTYLRIRIRLCVSSSLVFCDQVDDCAMVRYSCNRWIEINLLLIYRAHQTNPYRVRLD
jgi:hypothetical protein